MVKVLEQVDIDPIADQVDDMLAAAKAPERPVAPMNVGDLSDGGTVTTGGVTAQIRPMSGWGGKRTEKGRPAARRAWMWNGTESVLPLSWNPEGTQHDGARKYLLKRFCLCCHTGGFRGQSCPTCVKSNCEHCQGSTDTKKIIPCFYLRKEDVPFPERFYGDVDCFLSSCTRRGGKGFKTSQDMRVHARFRHGAEYRAYTEAQAATRSDEVTALREQVTMLMAAQVKATPTVTAPAAPGVAGNNAEMATLRASVEALIAQQNANKDRMAKARGARKKR